MNLRTKTLIIFGVGLILILAGFTVYSSYVLQKSYEDIEGQEIRQDIERVRFAIDNEFFVLDSSLLDWSSWDDTYYYAQGNYPAYEEDNLPKATFKTLGLNFLIVFNRTGDVIYANGYNDSTGEIEPISPTLLNRITEEYPLNIFDSPDIRLPAQGIFFVDSQPKIVAARPILKNNGDGPREGVIVMGRTIDEVRLGKLSRSTGVIISLLDPATLSQNPALHSSGGRVTTENGIAVQPVNQDIITGYTSLKEPGGTADSYILTVTKPRIIYQSGLSTINSFLFIVLIAILLFGILGLFFIDRLILSRVSSITSDIRKIGSGEENIRITEVPGNDELTQLSRAINQMLGKITLIQERYRSIVEDQTELICRFDPDGRITFMNSAFRRSIGGYSGVLGTITVYDLISARFTREQLEKLIQSLTPQSPIVSGEQEFMIEKDDISVTWTIRAIFDQALVLQEYQFVGSDITTRKQAETALQQVTRKLTLLNQVTFNDIQNAVFTLNGYLTLEKSYPEEGQDKKYLDMEQESVKKIEYSLNFAKNYQDLGITPPLWQDVHQSFIMGISHLNFTSMERTVHLDNLEIYADSFLERVFFTLAGNVLRHAKSATKVTLGYQLTLDGLLLFFEDNGTGIPDDNKEKIFERGYGGQQGMELFLVREILGITGITIRENGRYGSGARFEMNVPKRAYRYPGKK